MSDSECGIWIADKPCESTEPEHTIHVVNKEPTA